MQRKEAMRAKRLLVRLNPPIATLSLSLTEAGEAKNQLSLLTEA